MLRIPPYFPAQPRLPGGSPLKAFIDSQIRLCQDSGWILLVGGDLNWFASVALDTWQGRHTQRSACIASPLEDRGLDDTFRTRHRRLQAERPIQLYQAGKVAKKSGNDKDESVWRHDREQSIAEYHVLRREKRRQSDWEPDRREGRSRK